MAPIIRCTADVIATAVGILGILAFSLAPLLTTYPVYAVRQQLSVLLAPNPENTMDADHYQRLYLLHACQRNAANNETFSMRCTTETTGKSDEVSALNCDFRSLPMAEFMQLHVGFLLLLLLSKQTN